jgi:hypothetical protein
MFFFSCDIIYYRQMGWKMREMNQDPFKTWAAVAWYSPSPSYATLFGHILIFFLMDGWMDAGR